MEVELGAGDLGSRQAQQAGGQAGRQAGRLSRQVARQAGRQAGGQAGRQAGRQAAYLQIVRSATLKTSSQTLHG